MAVAALVGCSYFQDDPSSPPADARPDRVVSTADGPTANGPASIPGAKPPAAVSRSDVSPGNSPPATSPAATAPPLPATAPEAAGIDAGAAQGAYLSYIMLADIRWPEPDALMAAIRRRIPAASRFRVTREQDRQAGFGPIGGSMTAMVFIDAANPLSPTDSFIQSAWWWQTVAEDLARRRAHIIVSVSRTGDARADLLRLARLSAAVIDTSPAIGVIWETADAVWPANWFRRAVDTASASLPPVFVSYKIGHDTANPRPDGTPAWLGMSFGLRAFELNEVEVRGWPGDRSALVRLLSATAGHLLANGPAFEDGDIIGPTVADQYRVTVTASTLDPGRTVFRLRLLSDGAAPSS